MRDRVSPELAIAVLRRDGGCVAPRLGGSVMDCWGRDRIEHVKAEPRMGKRAEPRMDRLVTLCEGHTEPGMRAGYVWCTARENREAMREYLRTVGDHACDWPGCEGQCHTGDSCPCHPAGVVA